MDLFLAEAFGPMAVLRVVPAAIVRVRRRRGVDLCRQPVLSYVNAALVKS